MGKTDSFQEGSTNNEERTPAEPDALFGCYEIGPFLDEKTVQEWLDTLAVKRESAHYFSKDNSEITGYLVYLPKYESFAESKVIFEIMQEQGVADIWLFRKGKQKGNISMGVYTKKSNALRLQKKYANNGMMLKVKPRYQAKTQFFAKLSWDKQMLNVLTNSVTKIILAININEVSCER